MAVTGQDIINDVRALVIEPLPAFYTDARLLTLINLAQYDLVRRSRILECMAKTSTVNLQATYSLPGNFLGSLKVYFNDQQGGINSWIPLQGMSVEKMSQQYPNFLNTVITSAQFPLNYFFIGNKINLFPTPYLKNPLSTLKFIIILLI